ncbi:MAG: DNA alkylation repair protein [Planctomycetia bacterium]|nr:DNA alkylation repair protein [Planctomycetia bacterium]
MTAAEIIAELKPLGKESYKKVLLNHGTQEPVFGVSIAQLKKIQKRIKKDYQLALDLYDTGIYDAMYLAGLIADDQKMTKKDLQRWVENATSEALCSYTVPWVATEGRFGWELGLRWIESKKPSVAAAGWSTLVGLVAMKDDSELDLAALKKLLQRVEASVHEAPNRVRYAMVMFVIALGTYVKPLADLALKAAEKIGRVEVDVGKTACKIPFAPDYIRKIRQRGAVGKKRKTVKC